MTETHTFKGLTIRQWLRVFWHTRPGHSGGLVTTRRGVFCCCGTELSR